MMKSKTASLTSVALLSAVLCVLGPLSIPIGPVPVTLGVLGVFLCATILGPKKGAAAVTLYLLIGLAGLPVFSGFAGGPGKLFGPTGGYLLGYLPLVVLSGIFVDRFYKNVFLQAAGMLIGLTTLYLTGTLWLSYQASMPFTAAAAAGVLPFIPFDIAKLAAAIAIGRAIRSALVRAGIQKNVSPKKPASP